MTVSKEEANALRHCVSILAPLSTAQQRSTMALRVEARINGSDTTLLAFRFTQIGILFYPSDAKKAQQLVQQIQKAADAGELVTALPSAHKGALVSDLASWPDCPPIPEESPLRFWLSFMPKPALAQNSAKTAPVGAESVSGGVEPDKAGPLPLTTNEIANCFSGFRDWDVKRWKRELGSPDNWLRDCQHSKGTRGRGGYESTWWPVKIALALASQDQKSARHLPARFKRLEQLKPWLEELENNIPESSGIP